MLKCSGAYPQVQSGSALKLADADRGGSFASRVQDRDAAPGGERQRSQRAG
jgi:hypothetical protein